MVPSRVLWNVHSKDHAVTATALPRHAHQIRYTTLPDATMSSRSATATTVPGRRSSTSCSNRSLLVTKQPRPADRHGHAGTSAVPGMPRPFRSSCCGSDVSRACHATARRAGKSDPTLYERDRWVHTDNLSCGRARLRGAVFGGGARLPGSAGEAFDQQCQSLLVLLAPESASPQEGEQAVQPAPESLGQCVQVVVSGQRLEGLA